MLRKTRLWTVIGISLILPSAAVSQTPLSDRERLAQIKAVTKATGVVLPKSAIEAELAAPADVKAKLDAERAKMLAAPAQAYLGGKPTFAIGYTKALARPDRASTGLDFTPEDRARVQEQNQQTVRDLARESKIESAIQTRRGTAAGRASESTYAFGCSPALKAFDWRTKGAVTPVKDQNPCGSCWAFASVAALEGSYFITNRDRMIGSEQQVLDCSAMTGYDGKPTNTCNGGNYARAWDKLQGYGVAGSASYGPYTATQNSCRWAVATPYHWSAWGWVNDDQNNPFSPPVEKLKAQLCRRGPLATTIYASSHGFQSYRGNGSINEVSPPGKIDHAVTIVGWDDDKQSWLIKNSWGTGWGQQGFAWVRYGANNVGMITAWVQARKTVSLPDDCRTFAPEDARVAEVGGRFKVISGPHTIADAGADRAQAERTIAVVKHYKLAKQCYLGGRDWNFEYFLALNNKTPRDELAGETCRKFDIGNLDVDKDGAKWQIKDGVHRVKTFEREDDAWMAYAYLRRHVFTHQCNVGNGFVYYRR